MIPRRDLLGVRWWVDNTERAVDSAVVGYQGAFSKRLIKYHGDDDETAQNESYTEHYYIKPGCCCCRSKLLMMDGR